jgi:hypothetical protein
MKKIISLFSVLAAMLLTSALPAFSSGTGPFGSFGPTIDNYSAGVVDTPHVILFGGTGPYGVFGSVEGYNIVPSGEKKPLISSWGTGPYGVFNSYGMVARDKSIKNECLLVAMTCPLEEITK